MSVLDRAIVKAFERRRIAATASKVADGDGSAATRDLSASLPQPSAVENADIFPGAYARQIWTEPADVVADSVSPVIPAEEVTSEHAIRGDVPSEPTPNLEPANEKLEQYRTSGAYGSTSRYAGTADSVAEYVTVANAAEFQFESRAAQPIAQADVPPAVPQEWKWPEICGQLDQLTGDGFRQLAKHLQVAATQGLKVLAFVSSTPNVGRTSVLLTLTRILALEGRTHALLIDADRSHPEIGVLTGLGEHVGLSDVLQEKATLQQAVVPRLSSNISTLTMNAAVTEAEWNRLTRSLRSLVKQARDDYEMVLIDAGVFGPETKLADCWLRGAADAVITISRQLSGHATAHEVLNWKQIGIESLGVIETFS